MVLLLPFLWYYVWYCLTLPMVLRMVLSYPSSGTVVTLPMVTYGTMLPFLWYLLPFLWHYGNVYRSCGSCHPSCGTMVLSYPSCGTVVTLPSTIWYYGRRQNKLPVSVSYSAVKTLQNGSCRRHSMFTVCA